MGEEGRKKDKEFIGMSIDDYANIMMDRRRKGADFPSWEGENCYRCSAPLALNDGARVPDVNKHRIIIGIYYGHQNGCPKKD